jgi:HEAT repeat protein
MHRTPLTALAVLLGLAVLAPAQAPSFLNKSADHWLRALKAPRAALRRSAAFALGRLGDDAYMAVEDLARCLRNDRDAGVRDMAASAVGEIVHDLVARGLEVQSRWDQAGDALERALKDANPRVRRSAAYALGTFGRVADTAVPALKRALRDDHPGVRQNAAWALGRIGAGVDGATVAALCDLLRDESVLVRRDAAGALGKLGRDRGKSAARPLFELLKTEKDEVVLKSALNALSQLAGPEHRAQAPDLYRLLDSPDEDTARGAAFVLGNMGGEPALRAMPVLSKALDDPDPVIQAMAATALGNIGPDAAPAVRKLAAVLRRSRNPYVRRNAAIALGNIGRFDPDHRPSASLTEDLERFAVPALAEAMKPLPGAPKTVRGARPYEEAREFAAEALHHISFPTNEGALKEVREALARDPNPVVRHRCVWALFEVRDLEKYDLDKVLGDLLKEKARDGLVVRYDAARVLAFRLRERAPERTADVLLHMLKNKELLVYRGSGATVEGTPSEDRSGTTAVRTDARGDARWMAAQALAKLGEKASKRDDIVKALRAAAADRDAKLREEATKALKDLGLEE